MKTIELEDHGQDFLEWDIDDQGVVLESRPYQDEIWRGTYVHDPKEGECPAINLPRTGEIRTLNYPVVAIRAPANPFANADGKQTVDVAGRLLALERFGLGECHAALDVPGLQKTVEKKVRSRIRKLEKEQSNG